MNLIKFDNCSEKTVVCSLLLLYFLVYKKQCEFRIACVAFQGETDLAVAHSITKLRFNLVTAKTLSSLSCWLVLVETFSWFSLSNAAASSVDMNPPVCVL